MNNRKVEIDDNVFIMKMAISLSNDNFSAPYQTPAEQK